MRATIWAYEYRRIGAKFAQVTGERPKPGMKALLLVTVNFHEVYGMSLNVRDIDPSYTLGEMARKKQEIIARLRAEGLIDLNKGLDLPLVPQRIAVISSPTAAGYGDFFHQLDGNVYGYRFIHILFPAVMQGQEAEVSILGALERIRAVRHLYDIVAIIRGGGSVVDLSRFDSYDLGAAVARFPLPVVTGIGHERDETVVDAVAHTRMKTPTAVAEFFLSGMRGFEEQVIALLNRLRSSVGHAVKDERHRLRDLVHRLRYAPSRAAVSSRTHLSRMRANLKSAVLRIIDRETNRLARMEQAARHLDPSNVLRRGYSITRVGGKVIRDLSGLRKGSSIETELHCGSVVSTVESVQLEGKAAPMR
jgi:exodeoxyribonuclease VII large subunit